MDRCVRNHSNRSQVQKVYRGQLLHTINTQIIPCKDTSVVPLVIVSTSHCHIAICFLFGFSGLLIKCNNLVQQRWGKAIIWLNIGPSWLSQVTWHGQWNFGQFRGIHPYALAIKPSVHLWKLKKRQRRNLSCNSWPGRESTRASTRLVDRTGKPYPGFPTFSIL